MGSWSQVGQKSGSDLPILKIGETPVRLRFISGPGKFEGPEERWQHWPPDSDTNRSPILCIGARSGCIFHQEPIKWVKASEGGGSLKKTYLTNVKVYEMEKGQCVGAKVYVLGGNQIYDSIAQQASMLGVDPSDYEWVIGKTGTGKQTKYTATMIGVNLIEPSGVDLSTLEDQPAEWAADENPKLIDFDKFEGFKKRTPQEQMAWFDGRDNKGGDEEEASTTTSTETVTPPAAPAPTGKGKITLGAAPAATAKPAAQAPPPAPAAAPPPAPAPPAPAGPSQADIDAAKAKIDSWSAGSSENIDHLKYVLSEAGFDQSFKDAATLLLSLSETTPATPPPAPAATSTGGDLESLKKELQGALTTMQVFKSFPNMKKFFNLAGEGKNALNSLDENDFNTLLPIVRQGEDAVKAAIGV